MGDGLCLSRLEAASQKNEVATALKSDPMLKLRAATANKGQQRRECERLIRKTRRTAFVVRVLLRGQLLVAVGGTLANGAALLCP